MGTRASIERGIARRLVATLIVAVAVAAIWSIAIGWGAAIVASWSDTLVVRAESIIVTRDGTPLVRFYSDKDYQNASYRTLDGQPVEFKVKQELASARLVPPRRTPPIFDWPSGWGETLAASDFDRPPGAWYLVRDNRPLGRAYFIGYDTISRQKIGYIGRSGFSRSLPSADEWFVVGRQAIGLAATGGQQLSLNAPADVYDSYLNASYLPRWLVFVIDGDRLVEVDLRQRSVRDVFAAQGISSVAILSEVDAAEQIGAGQSDAPSMAIRLAFRTKDRIVVQDNSFNAFREFHLPASLASETVDVYAVAKDQILVQFTKRSAIEPPTERLLWVGSDGKVLREATVRLAQYANFNTSTNERTNAMLATGFIPIPVFWATMLSFAPLGEFMENRQPTYAAAVANPFGMLWPAILVALVIGSVSAALVGRWQRKYYRPHTKVWCAFAFLLGLPGVLAYWLEMRREKLESCTECKAVVPRDRDACASCRSPFPAPPLVGTELFA
jgi:hypothetical protein